MGQAKWKSFSKKQLIQMAKESFNKKDFFIKMGYKAYCIKTMNNILQVYPDIEEFLPFRKNSLRSKWKNFTKEQIIQFAQESKTRIEFMSKMGYTTSRKDIYEEIVQTYPDIDVQKHDVGYWEDYTEKELNDIAKQSANETEFCKKIGYTAQRSTVIKKIKEKYPDIVIPKDTNYCYWEQFTEKELQEMANNSIGMVDFYRKIGYKINQSNSGGKGKIVQNIMQKYPNFILPIAKNCSYGEQKILKILKAMPYAYQTQFYFKDLKTNNTLLRFDFAIFIDTNIIMIEYQGIQHYEEIPFFQHSLENYQYRDNLKRQYCKEHNIPLIEIPYWDYEILNENYIKEKLNEYCN